MAGCMAPAICSCQLSNSLQEVSLSQNFSLSASSSSFSHVVLYQSWTPEFRSAYCSSTHQLVSKQLSSTTLRKFSAKRANYGVYHKGKDLERRYFWISHSLGHFIDNVDTAVESLGGNVLEKNVSKFCQGAGKQYLKDMSFQEMEEYVEGLGNERKRARLLWTWLYRDGYWAQNASQMEGVSVKFRNLLEKNAEFDSLELEETRTSKDGTRKLTFGLKGGREGGGGVVETVLIPNGLGRHTICVSSQLGCAMGCTFCFTAKMGLQKNLSVGQIVDQVVQVRRLFTSEVGSIKNIVFMGMGEPLHNLDNVLEALSILVDPLGMAFSAPRVTVSTSGLVPEIRRFCRESSASLAVSLNATTDTVRSEIMPVNRRYNIATLLGALREEFPRARNQEHVLLEYVMLANVNDSLDDAYRLLELTRDLPCKINLIMFNAHQGTVFQPSTEEALVRFKETLIDGGRLVFVRRSRGDDEMAACGQLGRPLSSSLSTSLSTALSPALPSSISPPLSPSLT